jgi:hypothetical protein
MTSGKPIYTKVTIDNIDISDYLMSWTKSDTDGSDFIKSISIITNRGLENVITLDSDSLILKEVVVTRGDVTSTDYIIFKGVLKDFTLVGNSLISINCLDKLYLTTKNIITYSFDKDIDTEAGVISEILKTLINDYTSLTADATSVQDSGTINILDKWICKAETVYDKCKKLAELLSWILYYNPEDDLVHFEPKGFVNNSTIIQNQVNIIEPPKWKIDESLLYNKIRIDGASQETSTIESGQIGVTGDYTTSSISLLQKPLTTRVLCDAVDPPTTEKTFGIQNSSTSYDYYVDGENKKIYWSSTFTPGGSDYVIIEYTYMKPTPIIYSNIDSIAKYGEKYSAKIKDELKEVDDAELFAKQYINDHKNPIQSTEIKVINIKDMDVGQSIQIIDTTNNINNFFKISKLEMNYPYKYDKVSVTSDILEEADYGIMVTRRIKQLEIKDRNDFESLIEIKDFYDNIIAEDRYAILTKSVISDGFILGHESFGIIGTSPLGVSYSSSDVTQFIEQSEKKYVELFIDDTFKTSTTGTWDTTDGQLELVNGNEAISSAFAVDINNSSNNTYTSARFEITGTALDEITYYIGENNNVSITYTEVTTTGSTTFRTGTIYLTGTNKYGLNWKVEATDTITITKLIISYS